MSPISVGRFDSAPDHFDKPKMRSPGKDQLHEAPPATVFTRDIDNPKLPKRDRHLRALRAAQDPYHVKREHRSPRTALS